MLIYLACGIIIYAVALLFGIGLCRVAARGDMRRTRVLKHAPPPLCNRYPYPFPALLRLIN